MSMDELIKQCKTDAEMALIFVRFAINGELSVKELKKWLGALGYELNPSIEKYLIRNNVNNSRIVNNQLNHSQINL